MNNMSWAVRKRMEGIEEYCRRHRLVELRRTGIARNADATLEAMREGRAPYGSVEDLKSDLLGST